MLFNTLQFLLFFIIVTLSYFLVPHKYRWFLLLFASCFFYMAFVPVYIVILGGTIIVDYIAGICIENATGYRRKVFLITSLIANIGVLAVFKYYNFLNNCFTDILQAFHHQNPIPALKILLPIGLSFHTFQAMSYTIEVYRAKQKAERHFGIYALYVMFYPQLVAGPIERPQNLIHQFHTKHVFDFERFKSGLSLMIFGLFKKVVVADRLSIAVDYAYHDVANQSGLSLLIATFFYTFQIFCDFSGYSDMAIGAARIMGFDLMLNFNMPYLSKSLSEFWSRWHISLSTWFKDYVYIPLGGNRTSKHRWFFNLFIVFLLSGLWHGANWTFIAWGALHGIIRVLAILKNNLIVKAKLNFLLSSKLNSINIILTFLIVMCAWVFFRATSINEAFMVFHKFMHIGIHNTVNLSLNSTEIIFCFILILFLLLKEKFFFEIPSAKNGLYWAIHIILLFSCYFLGVFNLKQFIYFQF